MLRKPVIILGTLVIVLGIGALVVRADRPMFSDPNAGPITHKENAQLSNAPVHNERRELPMPQSLDLQPAQATVLDDAVRALVDKAVLPIASQWAHPGPFEVTSVLQVSPDVRIVAGWFSEVAAPGLVALAADHDPVYIPLRRDGAGGPPTLMGMKGNWVLIKEGNGYQVFNITSYDVTSSDENATPGKHASLGH